MAVTMISSKFFEVISKNSHANAFNERSRTHA
jgi:hypothetical protein